MIGGGRADAMRTTRMSGEGWRVSRAHAVHPERPLPPLPPPPFLLHRLPPQRALIASRELSRSDGCALVLRLHSKYNFNAFRSQPQEVMLAATSRTMPCPALAVFELFDAALRRQHGPVFDSQVESHCACRLQDARQVWILPAALVWSTCACPRCATRHLIACMPRV